MRAGLALIAPCLSVLLGCGGAQKPPEKSPADTSSLEPPASASSGEATSEAPGGAPTSPASDAPAKPAKAAAAASSAPADAPPAAAFHAAPSATGAIDGKPFAPRIGRVTGAMQKDGRIVVSLSEAGDCTSSPKAGDGTLTMTVEWKDGFKTDLGSLKRATRPGGGEISFSRLGGGGKGELSKTFKPTGRVTVVSAPTDQNATGKLKLDVQSGDFMLNGDIDVLMCVGAK